MSFSNTDIVFLQKGDISNKEIMTDEKVFVMVQGSRCGHCINAKPGFIEASRQVTNVMFATIQSDGDESERALSKELKIIDPSIGGIPAYLLFNKGKYVTTYKGQRDAASISKFLSDH